LLLCPLKDVRDALGVPLTASCRRDAASIERFRNLPEGTRACLLCFTDDGQHVGRVAIRLGLHGLNSAFAGQVEPWVAKVGPNIAAARWHSSATANTLMVPEAVRAIAIMRLLLRPGPLVNREQA
jgi:hypothetical protein